MQHRKTSFFAIQTGARKTQTSRNRKTNTEAKGNRTGERGTTKTCARTKRSSTQVNLLTLLLKKKNIVI